MIGPHGSSASTNDNGERLLSLCSLHKLCVGNTYFPHKTIHKKTWRSPDGNTHNEIDYICVGSRWRSSICDVRVFRGADMGSDHHLHVSTIRLKFKRTPARKTIRPFAVEKLKAPDIKQRFQLELRNRFQILQNTEGAQLEHQWTNIKDTMAAVANDVLGRRRGTQRERWIQERSWELIDERKRAKQRREQAKAPHEKERAEAQYQELDRRVKRSCRADKKAWHEQKCG